MKVQRDYSVNGSGLMTSTYDKKTDKDFSKMHLEDEITISNSARKLAMTARDKVVDFRGIHFSSICGEIKEIPAEYRCENLFSLELKAASISGGKSIFEGHAEEQVKVFEQWIDENAKEYMSEDEMLELKKQVSTIVAEVDDINAKEGYKGTSFESVFLLSVSEAGLNKVNEMFVPDKLQDEFSEIIKEYVHFNEAARNSIMEKMIPDYMVIGIGTQQETYKYKEEILKDELSFYQKEMADVKDLCNQFLTGKKEGISFYNEIEDYLYNYYRDRYPLNSQTEFVQEKTNNMITSLQKMYSQLQEKLDEGKKTEEVNQVNELEGSSQGETFSGSVTVNAQKLARMIAAAKTKGQLKMVISKIRGDIKQVKAAIEMGMSTQTELNKANSLLVKAQNRMGQVEDRKATPEEENLFSMASFM